MRPLLAMLIATSCTLSTSPCEEVLHDLALDAPSGYGFTAEEVLGYAEGVHATQLATREGESPLLIQLQRRGDNVAWAERAPMPSTTSNEATDGYAEPVCDDQLLVPVRLELRTPGGQLDERWDTELRASDASSARFTHSIDARRLRGSLDLDLEGTLDPRLRVEGTLTAGGSTTGNLRLTATRASDGEKVSWVVGAWPAR
ncbi:MAG: hypothetical protein EA397_10355 [Deltaproteobacteria bacterium]|nr:MAG: hypothetical protein EA397_10355 [Deltaproteobacteria bacterium]